MRRAILGLALLLSGGADAQTLGSTPVGHGGGLAPDTPPAEPLPLPTLPLPTGAKVVAFSDSHSAFNNNSAKGDSVLAAPAQGQGLIEAAWSSDPRFNFDTWYEPNDPFRRNNNPVGNNGTPQNGANQGIASEHLVNGNTFGGGSLQRLRYVQSRAPDIMILNCGGNSINSGDVIGSSRPGSAPYIEQQLDAILTSNAQRGIWTILQTIYPTNQWSDGSMSDERNQIRLDLNTWIRAQVGRAGVKVADSETLLGGAAPVKNYYIEGADTAIPQTHLNYFDAPAVAAGVLLPVLTTMVLPGSVFDQNAANANLYDATTRGCLGTTGTKTGSNSTGTVATGFNVRVSRNTNNAATGSSTRVVSSKDTTDSTSNKQVLTITGPGRASPHVRM